MSRTYRLFSALLIVSVLWLTGGAVALAQAPDSDVRHITVVGRGLVNAVPDIATLSLGVETQSPDISQAMSDNTAAMDAVYAALSEAGVADADVQTSDYSIYFDEGYRGDGMAAQPTFRVFHMVRATIRDLAGVSDAIDAAVNAGANRMYGVTFSLSDTTASESLAREKAVTDANARAEHLAGLVDASLGEVLSITEVIGGGYALPLRSGGAADGMGGGGPAIAPGQLEFTVDLQVTYALAAGGAGEEPSQAETGAEAAPALTGEVSPGTGSSFDLAVTFSDEPVTEDGRIVAAWVDVTRQGEDEAFERLDVLFRTPYETSAQLALWSSETTLLFEDINFDGNVDFAVVEPSGATWQVSHWFLYDAESDGFVTNDLTEQLSLLPWHSYELDADARLITVTNFVGATGEVETVYQVGDDGSLTLVRADSGAPTIEAGPFSGQ